LAQDASHFREVKLFDGGNADMQSLLPFSFDLVTDMRLYILEMATTRTTH